MTVETAYRRIKAYFSKPGAKFGYDSEAGTCRYRAQDPDDGIVRKCAVGVLIPDELYDEAFEDDVSPDQLVWEGVINGVMTNAEKTWLGEFLLKAQEAHDTHAVGKKYVPPESGVGVGTNVVVERTIPAFLRELDDVAKRFDVFV